MTALRVSVGNTTLGSRSCIPKARLLRTACWPLRYCRGLLPYWFWRLSVTCRGRARASIDPNAWTLAKPYIQCPPLQLETGSGGQ